VALDRMHARLAAELALQYIEELQDEAAVMQNDKKELIAAQEGAATREKDLEDRLAASEKMATKIKVTPNPMQRL